MEYSFSEPNTFVLNWTQHPKRIAINVKLVTSFKNIYVHLQFADMIQFNLTVATLDR
jgi:hypothetical protein